MGSFATRCEEFESAYLDFVVVCDPGHQYSDPGRLLVNRDVLDKESGRGGDPVVLLCLLVRTGLRVQQPGMQFQTSVMEVRLLELQVALLLVEWVPLQPEAVQRQLQCICVYILFWPRWPLSQSVVSSSQGNGKPSFRFLE